MTDLHETGTAPAMSQETALVEGLAALRHESWIRWMTYLLGKFAPNEDGSITLPAAYVQALRRQMGLPYAELTDAEQQSDRDEVAHDLPIIRAYVEELLHLPAAPEEYKPLEFLPLMNLSIANAQRAMQQQTEQPQEEKPSAHNK